MKAVWISLILFALLLIGTVLNVWYIHQTADHFYKAAEDLAIPEMRDATLSELEAFWERQEPLISLTVSFRELDHFGEIIAQLRWAQEIGDDAEFSRYRALLIDAVEELMRTEKFSVENLF